VYLLDFVFVHDIAKSTGTLLQSRIGFNAELLTRTGLQALSFLGTVRLVLAGRTFVVAIANVFLVNTYSRKTTMNHRHVLRKIIFNSLEIRYVLFGWA